MSGEGCLDRDLGRLVVADLADQDDVRVGPQDRTKRGGERQPRPRMHLHLGHKREVKEPCVSPVVRPKEVGE